MRKYDFIPEDFESNSEYESLFPGKTGLKFVIFDNFLHLNIRDANAYTNSADGKSKVIIPDCTRVKDYFTKAEEEIEHEDGTKERIVKEIFEKSEVIVGLPADQLCEGYVFIR